MARKEKGFAGAGRRWVVVAVVDKGWVRVAGHSVLAQERRVAHAHVRVCGGDHEHLVVGSN